MTIEEAFGVVVRRLRKELRLSQDELSKISSLDRVFISRLERGKQQPTLVTIFELAAGLNVSAVRIINEAELLLLLNKVKVCKQDLKTISYEKLWELFGGKIMGTSPGNFNKVTILLVEDELPLRQFLSALLTSRGFNIVIAEDGQDAIDKYKENFGSIDLVLMDIMMPRKDGVTAHKEIIDFDQNARILLMSGYSTLSLGGIEHLNFIQKPLLPDKLFTSINELLDMKNNTPLSKK